MDKIRSRREEYSQATRQALIDAAARTFVERGYARTSLDEVAAAARVTKGALYHHFSGKQALLEEAIDQLERAVYSRILGEAAHHQDDLWEGALAAVNVFLDACCEPIYGRLCFIEGPAALGWNRWRQLEDKYAYQLTQSLLEGLLAAGVVREVPIKATTWVVVGMFIHAAISLAEAPPEEQPQLRSELGTVLRELFTGLRVRDPQPPTGAERQQGS